MTETKMSPIENLIPEFRKMAKGLSIEWPGIDAEDIQQEMGLKVVENWDNLPENGRRKIALGLAYKRGVQYCSQERQFYQAKSAEWIYTPKEVRTILAEYYFDYDAWNVAPKKPEIGAQSLMGDGISVALWDVETGINAVPEQDQASIISAFQMGVKPATDAERKRVDRAVEKVTAYLNRDVSKRFDHSDHDGPGARAALTNTQARHRADY